MKLSNYKLNYSRHFEKLSSAAAGNNGRKSWPLYIDKHKMFIISFASDCMVFLALSLTVVLHVTI